VKAAGATRRAPTIAAVLLWGAVLALSVHAATLPLQFPADHGSHPDFRTEWWYITGSLATPAGEKLGFQVTFFRSRPDVDGSNPSAFAPRELIIAHAAISDPRHGSLWRDQRIARSALGLAGAKPGSADVWLDRWHLRRDGTRWLANLDSETLGLSLELAETQSPLLNGENGFSKKGPTPEFASWYYSLPQLHVKGTVARNGGRPQTVTGTAWLDHEWSSKYLDAEATGWDWIGINLDDGGALMAFRMRGRDGRTRWSGGTLRSANGQVRTFAPQALGFEPGRSWQSPRTGIRYPVEWRVVVDNRVLQLKPLMADQENDARLSAGAIYWEGAVTAFENGKRIGSGYLELTGYGEPLKLP
jgi:predicted secreted hydrolase